MLNIIARSFLTASLTPTQPPAQRREPEMKPRLDAHPRLRPARRDITHPRNRS